MDTFQEARLDGVLAWQEIRALLPLIAWQAARPPQAAVADPVWEAFWLPKSDLPRPPLLTARPTPPFQPRRTVPSCFRRSTPPARLILVFMDQPKQLVRGLSFMPQRRIPILFVHGVYSWLISVIRNQKGFRMGQVIIMYINF